MAGTHSPTGVEISSVGEAPPGEAGAAQGTKKPAVGVSLRKQRRMSAVLPGEHVKNYPTRKDRRGSAGSQTGSADEATGSNKSLASLKSFMSTKNLAAKLSRNRMRTSSIRTGGLTKAKSVDLGDGVELTEEMIAEFKECFTLFDKSGDGSVSVDEVGEVMKQLGADLSRERLERLVTEVDKDGSGELEFPEFIQLMARQMRDGTDEKEMKEMFLMLSNGEKLVPVVAVRSMLYKLVVQNPDADHKVSAMELQEMMEDALGIQSPDDDEVMTYSQFKRMMDYSVTSPIM